MIDDIVFLVDCDNTVPEKTLLAFAEHGIVNGSMPPEGAMPRR